MYDMKRRVAYSQVNSDLKMNMAAIADVFQDCTLFHSESLGRGMKGIEVRQTAWFLAGWQIEVLCYPEYGEEITVRTWPYDFKGMYGYRNFDILNALGNPIVQANSIWIFMDLNKMQPAKPSEEEIQVYGMEPALDMEYAPRKIKVFEEECLLNQEHMPIVVKPSFLDSNHHVNNGRYVEEALNYVRAENRIRKMRVDYRKAATLKDVMYPHVYERDNMRQVVFEDEGNKPYVIVEFEE